MAKREYRVGEILDLFFCLEHSDRWGNDLMSSGYGNTLVKKVEGDFVTLHIYRSATAWRIRRGTERPEQGWILEVHRECICQHHDSPRYDVLVKRERIDDDVRKFNPAVL